MIDNDKTKSYDYSCLRGAKHAMEWAYEKGKITMIKVIRAAYRQGQVDGWKAAASEAQDSEKVADLKWQIANLERSLAYTQGERDAYKATIETFFQDED